MKATLPAILLLSLACMARAEDKPLLAIPGKVLYENTFASGPDAKWHAAKGAWEAAEGALRGSEKTEDHHPGVTRLPLKLQDFIVEYEFKLDGAKQTTLSINDAKEHVARVLAGPAFVQVQKDDHDHEGPDKAVVFGRMAADLKPGTWHKLRMELVGDTMLGKVDDLVAFGSNDLFKADKASLGFTVAGQSVDFRNLKIWDATLNPDWEAVKATLPKAVPPVAGAGAGKKQEPKN